MSPALPVVKARECLHALQRAGFYIDHQTGATPGSFIERIPPVK